MFNLHNISLSMICKILICVILILTIITTICIIKIYDEKENSKNIIQELNTVIDSKTNEINGLHSKMTDIDKNINQLKNENTELKQQITDYKTTLTEYEKSISEYQTKISEYETKISKYESTRNIGTQNASNNTSKNNVGYFKSWTDYKVLNRNSTQWKIQSKAYTDKNGLRKIGDYYLCAIGTGWDIKLGEKAKVYLSTGNSFLIIMCDIKDDMHTDSKTHTYTTKNKCMVEFYVEESALPRSVRSSGSVSSISYFSGRVTSIEKI